MKKISIQTIYFSLDDSSVTMTHLSQSLPSKEFLSPKKNIIFDLCW